MNTKDFFESVSSLRRQTIDLIDSKQVNPKIVPALQQFVQNCLSVEFVRFVAETDGISLDVENNPA